MQNEFQDEFLKRLNTKSQLPKIIIPSLLSHLLEYNDEIIQMSLGEFGQKLKDFVQVIDFSHPEIEKVFNNIFSKDFSQECLELLALAEFAKTKQFNRIIPVIGKIITSDIRIPSCVRLLKDPKERKEIRSSKRMQIIDLDYFYRDGEQAWNNKPNNFNNYLRFSEVYLEDIKNAEQKAEKYKKLGCLSLANEITKDVIKFKEYLDQAYYGFNQISLVDASVILAKNIGYNYKISNLFEGNKIIINRKFFYNFDPISDDLPFNYEPRLYPLHNFWEILSQQTLDIVNTLESFPDAGNKPIFDHLCIIVPGTNFPEIKRDYYSIINREGKQLDFDLREDALKLLDTILLESKYYSAIIVGEKDNKFYFVCYAEIK